MRWLIVLLVVAELWAQDPNYSLHFGVPVTIGPMFHGLAEGKAALIASNRTRKMTDIENYSTSLFSANLTLENDWFEGGAGLFVALDRAAGYNTTEVQLGLAYEAPLGKKVRYDHLRAGFQAGVVNRSIDINSYVFEDQFDGKGFPLPTSEPFASFSNTNLDFAIGLMYYRTRKIKGNPEFNPYIGFALHHINRPYVSFFSAGTGERISMRYTGFVGARLYTRTPLDINLNVIYMRQNNSYLVSINPFVRFIFYEHGIWFGKEKAAVLAGTIIRPKDSFVSYLGFEIHNNFAFAFAYDLLTSKTTIVSKNFGGLQIFARYVIHGERFKGSELPFPAF